MAAIRSGYWKELKDRFQGNLKVTAQGGILMAAASRAVVDGDVFIACGSTVEATKFSTSSSAASRSQIANSLRSEVKGSGSCSACGTKGVLYGCGLCRGCNNKWCQEFELTGKQLDIKNLAYLRYGRGGEGSVIEEAIKIIAEEWRRFKKVEDKIQVAGSA